MSQEYFCRCLLSSLFRCSYFNGSVNNKRLKRKMSSSVYSVAWYENLDKDFLNQITTNFVVILITNTLQIFKIKRAERHVICIQISFHSSLNEVLHCNREPKWTAWLKNGKVKVNSIALKLDSHFSQTIDFSMTCNIIAHSHCTYASRETLSSLHEITCLTFGSRERTDEYLSGKSQAWREQSSLNSNEQILN